MAEINDLNIVDASNTGRFPEAQAPSTLNDGARALEGLIARWHKDLNASVTTTGTSTAYVYAANQTISAYYDGLMLGVDFHTACGAAPTINVDAVGAKSLKWPNGTALAANDVATGQKAILVYDGTDMIVLTAGGNAAAHDVGVASGNIPQMDATGYPAADGSQITNLPLPRGYIDGLILSNNATDPAKDIDISAGQANNASNTTPMALSSTLVKQLDAAWAVGTNQGGLDTGTVAANTWYHVWLIKRTDTGVVDALFSTSATAPTMPTNYTKARRIGAVLTDATPDIIKFFQHGDNFYWDVPVQDYDQANPGTAGGGR